MVAVSEKFAFVLGYAKTVPGSVYIHFLTLVVGITALLIIFQHSILHLIPMDFTLDHIFLNMTTPNPSSMFLSNYMHNPFDPTHITNNLSTTAFLLFAVFIAGTVVLPAIGYRMPPRFFLLTYLIFFLLLPFAISGISIWSARITGKSWSSGFSGISFALFGLLVFLMLSWAYTTTLQSPNRDTCRSVFVLLSMTLICLISVIAVILLDLRTQNVNVYAHLGGFALGLLVPALVGMGLTAETRGQKAAVAAMLGLVILLPSVGWLVV
ncbi:rhomboid family intramembrane serine protease [Methanoculleus sp. Wushi-C6]|uniref:Rhomboid family intramembrane serine protease n=1 Tax=Methanoculleus caldifontis TaxID=2651577 RepID=A0ABU3WY40_9EURY|nr:rhomboid family intramembrane serine protease [Methanoculleus sp. Wushi-C6]MDV2480714.1 rhomboid family intramembrane serine protease [Methanoculleus sp. Wushi-C6]